MSWSDLDPAVKRAVLIAEGVDTALRIAALVDLTRRPAEQVRGKKAAWAAAIILVNSLGVVPVTYFVRGRRG